MATSQMSSVIQHLRRVVLRDGAGMTDGQLLESFVRERDDAAFAALVRRHGPMIWGVCRRLLRSHHDAEDAFQATFLVLARKAATIQQKELVANWLYGVAHQTSVKARALAAKRGVRERQVTEMPEPTVPEQDLWNVLQPLLDQELSHLPDKYRVLIVLCDLEGKTRKDVAQQLGCPEGTVAGRLARARVMLAKRLAHRGLSVSGGMLGVVLSARAAAASAPATVVSSTIHAATLVAAGKAVTAGVISANVAALTQGVLKAMFVTKLKLATAVLLLGVGLGAGVLATAQTDRAQPPLPAVAALTRVDTPAAKEDAPKPTDLEALLKAKDFWAKTGAKMDHPELTGDDRRAIRKLVGAADLVVRIRAFKLRLDIDRVTKVDNNLKQEEAEEALVAAFAYLEANINKPTDKFRPQLGITHASVVRKTDDADGVWILVEDNRSVNVPSSGINIRWNPKKKVIDKVDYWGLDRSR